MIILKIGNINIDNPIMLAPMAGVSNPSYIKLCEEFGLKTVPIIAEKDKFNFKAVDSVDKTVENLLAYVDNFKYRTYFEDASPSQIAEGVVFRMTDMTNSFKVVSNKFLLKGGE